MTHEEPSWVSCRNQLNATWIAGNALYVFTWTVVILGHTESTVLVYTWATTIQHMCFSEPGSEVIWVRVVQNPTQ